MNSEDGHAQGRDTGAGGLATIVSSAAGLEPLLELARKEGIVALDTESNGFYAYHERICLLQLQVGEQVFLVDALVLPRDRRLAPLRTLLGSREITKVMHGAEFDVLGLKRDLGIGLTGLFDTMHAARLLQAEGLSLDKLVLQHFGVALDKSFQRYDWGRRPLAQKAIRYAAADVRYLLPLHARLQSELRARGLLQRAAAAFARVEGMKPRPRVFDPLGYQRLRGYGRLGPEERKALAKLFVLREEIARRSDLAPFRVLNTETLLRLAKDRPRDPRSLQAVPGVPAWLLRQGGPRLLEALGSSSKEAAGVGVASPPAVCPGEAGQGEDA